MFIFSKSTIAKIIVYCLKHDKTQHMRNRSRSALMVHRFQNLRLPAFDAYLWHRESRFQTHPV